MDAFDAVLFLGLKYKSLTISLSDACAEIGIRPSTGANQLSAGAFPIPTSKVGGKRVVDIRDLALYIDERREKARQEWEASRLQIEC